MTKFIVSNEEIERLNERAEEKSKETPPNLILQQNILRDILRIEGYRSYMLNDEEEIYYHKFKGFLIAYIVGDTDYIEEGSMGFGNEVSDDIVSDGKAIELLDISITDPESIEESDEEDDADNITEEELAMEKEEEEEDAKEEEEPIEESTDDSEDDSEDSDVDALTEAEIIELIQSKTKYPSEISRRWQTAKDQIEQIMQRKKTLIFQRMPLPFLSSEPLETRVVISKADVGKDKLNSLEFLQKIYPSMFFDESTEYYSFLQGNNWLREVFSGTNWRHISQAINSELSKFVRKKGESPVNRIFFAGYDPVEKVRILIVEKKRAKQPTPESRLLAALKDGEKVEISDYELELGIGYSNTQYNNHFNKVKLYEISTYPLLVLYNLKFDATNKEKLNTKIKHYKKRSNNNRKKLKQTKTKDYEEERGKALQTTKCALQKISVESITHITTGSSLLTQETIALYHSKINAIISAGKPIDLAIKILHTFESTFQLNMLQHTELANYIILEYAKYTDYTSYCRKQCSA